MKRRPVLASIAAAVSLPEWWPFGSADAQRTDGELTLEELADRVNALEGDHAELDTATEALAGRIEDAEADVDDHETRITDLESDTTDGDSPWSDTDDGLLETPDHTGIDVTTVAADNLGAAIVSYTGDGATDGREITLGFEPATFSIHRSDMAEKFEGVGTGHAIRIAGGSLSTDISDTTTIHTSSNGVMVGNGDSDGNEDGVEYQLVAWPQA